MPSQQQHTWHFNPRSRMGSDKQQIENLLYVQKFQSTLPHGERRSLSLTHLISSDFNPRSRMGSDLRSAINRLDHSQFQSTLPHGERQQKHEISSLFL